MHVIKKVYDLILQKFPFFEISIWKIFNLNQTLYAINFFLTFDVQLGTLL